MIRFALFAITTLSTFYLVPAHAEVSEDLRFCAALKSSKERLACYDAAMRLGKSAPVASVRAARPTLPLTAYLPAESKKARFGGLYAGVTGGYEFQASNTSLASPGGATGLAGAAPQIPFFIPVVPVDSLKGAKVGAVFGYNGEVGALLAGFEGRAQYSFSRSSQTALSAFSTFGPDASTQRTDARFHHWQVDFSARSGIVFGDWLFFAKTGIGAEETLFKSTFDISLPMCDAVAAALTGCNPVTNIVPTTTQTDRTVTPIAIIGGGLERNFENYFIRAEGELTAHFIKGGGSYYSPDVNVTGGYRF